MKFNLAISLLVHVVIFAFLNIHKNELGLVDYSFVSLENDNQIYLKENALKSTNPSLLLNEYIDNLNDTTIQDEERILQRFWVRDWR